MANQITPNPSVPSQVVQEVKFPKFVNNLGIIPTSYKDSMSYYETLTWLCKFLEETVIPTVNENGEATQELQGLYAELNSYVANYFSTLDVQEEINNKLDQMVQDGTFEEALSQYFTDLENHFDDKIDAFENQVNQELNSFNSRLGAIASGSPAGVYPTKQALQLANPDHSRIYVVNADGDWYYWDSTQNDWVAGGDYQASVLSEDVDELKYTVNKISQPIQATFNSSNLSKIANAYIGLSTIGSGTEGGAYSCYMRCLPNKAYVISKLADARFVVACSEELPQIGTPIYSRIDYGSASSITYNTSNNARYIIIYYYWNTACVHSEADIFASFSINGYELTAKDLKAENDITTINNNLQTLNSHDSFIFPNNYKTYTTIPENHSQTGKAFILINTQTVGKGYFKTLSISMGAENNSKVFLYEKNTTTYILKDEFTFNANSGENVININKYYENNMYVGAFGKINYITDPNYSFDVFNFSESNLTISDKLNTLGNKLFINLVKGNEIDYLHEMLSTEITVSPNGLYNTIQKGINAVADGGTVYVEEGTYLESIDVRNKTINIIGKNKYNCILQDNSGDYNTPPLEMSSGSIQNMTIIETSENATPDTPGITNPTRAYCIHADFDQMTNKTLRISNCILKCNKRACIGIGVRNGFTFIMENSYIWSGVQADTNVAPRGAFYIHSQDGTETSRASIILRDNFFVCDDVLAMCLEDYGGIGFNCQFMNNTLVANTDDVSDDIIQGRNEETISFTNNVTANGGITRFCTCNGNNIDILNYSAS